MGPSALTAAEDRPPAGLARGVHRAGYPVARVGVLDHDLCAGVACDLERRGVLAWVHHALDRDRALVLALVVGALAPFLAGDLGSGRTITSEIEAPNMLANLV
jgi:hypothetical protein